MVEFPSVGVVTAAILAVTLLSCAWKVVEALYLRPRRIEWSLRRQGLAGTAYFPMIGDIWKMNRMIKDAELEMTNELSNDIVPLLHPFHQQSIENYGKCCFMWMGPTPALILTNGELAKEVFSKVYEFEKPVFGDTRDVLLDGLVGLEGERWAKHRKILNPAFHLEKLKPLVAACSESCIEIINKLEAMLSPEGSCEVDILPYIDTMTGNIISRVAFGSSYDEGKMIFRLLREQIRNLFKIVFIGYIPGYSLMPTKINRRMKQNESEIRTLLKGIIDRRVQAKESGDVKGCDDILGHLLESNYQEIEANGHEKGMSMEDVISECKILYLAGQEASAGLLIWALILLSKHRDWQAKAREEILRVFGDKEINFDGLSRLKTVNMILHEVLRLYPPATILYRKVSKATQLGPYYLPAGVQIQLPVLLIHHDQQVWGEDAKVFKPERFSEGVSKASTGNSPLPFLPFGSGPRVCIGQNFALLEAKAVLVMILRQFSIELSPSYKHAPAAYSSIRPELGAPMIFRKL